MDVFTIVIVQINKVSLGIVPLRIVSGAIVARMDFGRKKCKPKHVAAYIEQKKHIKTKGGTKEDPNKPIDP